MSDQWYLAVNGKQEGPYSVADIQAKLRSGHVGPQTHVFKTGMSGWQTIGQVPELQTLGSAGSAPPPPPSGGQTSHEIDYEIFGEEMQFVEVELDPMETVIAEAGAMMFIGEGIEMESRFGDGSQPDKGFMGKMFDGLKRKMTGESLFMTWFTNRGQGKRQVAFGAPYPGKIIPLDLREIGGEFICQKDAFLCAAMGTNLGIALNKRFGGGLFGGEGFIMQRLRGDGMAFIHAGGTIVERELSAGETLRVDTGCVVGYTSQVQFDVQMAGNLKSAFFGGEGFFLATLTGPGKVWLQSLPFSRFADRVISAAGAMGRKGDSGGLANILEKL